MRRAILSLTVLLAFAGPSRAAPKDPEPVLKDPRQETLLDQVGYDQNLDAQVPADAAFRDEGGRAVRLGDYFGERPVVLALVYYECPMLCGQTLRGLASSLKPLKQKVGTDFDVVIVSISPEEGPDLAALKKAATVDYYGLDDSAPGWHFLTGEKPEIDRLARVVGFRYSYNPATRLYAHAAGVMLLTPEGRIARYFYGVEYPAKDLQFGLIEASAGRIGSPIAKVLLFCYNYDAATGKYTVAIWRVTQIAAGITALGLGASVVLMLRRERRRAASKLPSAPVTAAPPLNAEI